MLSDMLIRQLHYRLGKLPVNVRLWNGEMIASPSANVELTVNSSQALRTLARPSMGRLARAYVEGAIDLAGRARDILALGKELCQDEICRERAFQLDWRWWRNSRRNARQNISYHYDVSNDFYELWLDPKRVYSCAYFETPDTDLATAQQAKLDLICRKLMLKPGERLLDIGCGWGGLIFNAVENYGVTALGITLSQNQHDHVAAEIERRGLQDRMEVRLMDYRDVPEDQPYDKIASVGMFEHVGRRHLPAYFGKIYRLLRPGGLVMNHGITSVALTAGGLGSGISEFIDDYVFPGGELQHASTVMQELAAAGLEPLDAENLRPHYGRTLWHWVEGLEANEQRAIELVGEHRYRIWRIYMAGSAYAFDNNWLALFQILGGRPADDGRQEYPFTRKHVYCD